LALALWRDYIMEDDMSVDDKMKRMMVVWRKENHREKRNMIMKSGRHTVNGQVVVTVKAEQMSEIRRVI
jgi:hypothetical protein